MGAHDVILDVSGLQETGTGDLLAQDSMLIGFGSFFAISLAV